MSRDRRAFLKSTAAALTAAGSVDCATGRQDAPGTNGRRLDRALLRAVGDAVLPVSIGNAGRERAVVAFEIWLQEFEPGAELTHPYGGSVVPYGPADPLDRWAEQLADLNAGAQDRFMGAFADLSRDDRRAALAERIADQGNRFPGPAAAAHVAVGLMAHYYASSDATNTCYGRSIDKLTCRPIATSGEPPLPIDSSE